MDEFITGADPMVDRAGVMAHLAVTVDAVENEDAKRFLLKTMETLLFSILPRPAKIIPFPVRDEA